MAFTINRNLVFIDGIQFMNSSLDALVKNLSDNDFKHLSQEFSSNLLELVKQKGSICIHMNIWTVLKSFLMISGLRDVNFLVL